MCLCGFGKVIVEEGIAEAKARHGREMGKLSGPVCQQY